jgi:peptidyl-prolyl cis-trans isomerase SurA
MRIRLSTLLACAIAAAAIPAASQTLRAPAAAAGPAAPLREGVAAVVNDEIISTYDLRQRTLLLIISSGVQPSDDNLPEIQKEALRSLVDEHLQMQEIRRLQAKQKVNVEPADKEVDEQISAMAQQNGMQGSQLLASLASAGVDATTLREQIRVDTAWRRYVGGRFGSAVNVGSDQVDSAMKRVIAAAAKPQYQVAEILIDAQRVGGQEQAEAGAKQLVDQLEKGAPFAAVARQFSAASSSINGGEAGWLVSGDIQPSLEAALLQMRPGQVSQPIPVTGGVYILLLHDKRAGAGQTLVNLKQAALRLPQDAGADAVAAAQAKLAALKTQVKGCQDLEAQAGKVDGVVAGDLGEADVNDLAQGFKDAIANLKVGEVSAPVRTSAGLHLVALCGRRAAAADGPTRTDLENRIYEQELGMIARRELRNLRNSASIENR